MNTSTKPKILMQLDGDKHASMFDAVVAVDSEIDHLLQYRQVEVDDVRDLVHGTIFTRGPKHLKRTAIFIGGSNVEHGEALLAAVRSTFFGPMRVSVMLDANGANTTAAAAVLAVRRHVPLSEAVVTVLAATGPVGQRAALLAAREGAEVRIASRRLERAEQVRDAVAKKLPHAKLTPVAAFDAASTGEAMEGANVLIAAGAAGVELVSAETRRHAKSLKAIVDLNAVPPAGVAGVDVMAEGQELSGAVCYGAIGVGGLKMKIHKAAITKLFETNDLVLDAVEVYELGKSFD